MSDKIREEFEVVFHNEYNLSKRDDGLYMYHQTQNAFRGFMIGWEKSRSALCVDMPRCWNDEQRDYRDDMVKSLDSAGVRHQ